MSLPVGIFAGLKSGIAEVRGTDRMGIDAI
jgi:hypothetical protein